MPSFFTRNLETNGWTDLGSAGTSILQALAVLLLPSVEELMLLG